MRYVYLFVLGCLTDEERADIWWSALSRHWLSCTGCCQYFRNSLRPRQNKRHFADDVFKCNFLNEKDWIPIKISLKLVPKGPINNIPAFVQIMAWRRTGDRPLSEPMMTQFNNAYMHHSASMSLYEISNVSAFVHLPTMFLPMDIIIEVGLE